VRTRLSAACALFALAAAACGGNSGTSSTLPSAQNVPAHRAERTAAPGNAITDPGFESGGFAAGWTQCGTIPGKATISKAVVHSGTYSALLGSASKPEVDGTTGVCQSVTVPAGATLAFWVYEGTNDTVSYADQEADLLDGSGTQVAQLYKEASNAKGWVQKSFSLSSYAGQTLTLFFAVKGNGWTSGYVYEYLDDVSLTGSGSSTPTPSPSPTSSPASSPYPCNDAQFVTDQQEFAAGKISADQLVDVCATVTQVLPAKTTSSGRHGYFYVSIPGSASPGTIEIVSNLDAMAEAPTGDPPSTWPWVSAGQYVYVQGRYYYDSSSSQGIDWTEDDTGSWPYVGWVVVCNSSGGSCSKYW